MPGTSAKYSLEWPLGSEAVDTIDNTMQTLVGSIEAALDLVMPPGTIVMTARATAPTGWLLCDGAAVSRSAPYDVLFAAISTTYGVGNGSSTFNLPDLRGRVPIGVDGAAGRMSSNDSLGNAGGVETVTLQLSQIPSHRHRIKDNTAVGGTTSTSIAKLGVDPNSNEIYIDNNTGINDLPYIENVGGSGSHNNMPPFAIVNYIIRF